MKWVRVESARWLMFCVKGTPLPSPVGMTQQKKIKALRQGALALSLENNTKNPPEAEKLHVTSNGQPLHYTLPSA